MYQILASGHSMVEYEERQSIYAFLNIPNLLRMHWSDSSGWKMAEALYDQVKLTISCKISNTMFVSLTCDEVTTVDNGSWICIHAYIVENYVRIPYLLSLQHVVYGAGADNLTHVIVKALEVGGLMDGDVVSRRLLSFGANGTSAFQRS